MNKPNFGFLDFLFLVFLVLVLFGAFLYRCGDADALSQSNQKFKTVFTITYNSLTLQEAAKKETMLMEACKDACKMKADLSSIDDPNTGGVFIYDGDSYFSPYTTTESEVSSEWESEVSSE